VRSGCRRKAVATLHELHLEVKRIWRRASRVLRRADGTRRDLGLSLGIVYADDGGMVGGRGRDGGSRWKELEGTVVNDETIRIELIR